MKTNSARHTSHRTHITLGFLIISEAPHTKKAYHGCINPIVDILHAVVDLKRLVVWYENEIQRMKVTVEVKLCRASLSTFLDCWPTTVHMRVIIHFS